MHIIFESFIRR